MKKWIIGAGSIFLLFVISSYIFIPEKIVVARSITANANQAGVYRFLNDESNWTKWWPGHSSVIKDDETAFQSGGYRFKKTKMLYESFEIVIEKDGKTESSLLYLFSLGKDSVKINWNATIRTGKNPFSKIRHYFKAKELSNQFERILATMQKYIGNVKNIYGIDIRKEKVKVEFLVTTKKSFTEYPTTENIYEMISQIKNYIARLQGKEEDYPMLHINTSDSAHFNAQVAIPVNKNLPETDIFSSKKMLKGGDILVTEITGGKTIVDSARGQVEQYAADHKYLNIAIPFQSLVTDRMKEPDSSKWLTRIYFPII